MELPGGMTHQRVQSSDDAPITPNTPQASQPEYADIPPDNSIESNTEFSTAAPPPQLSASRVSNTIRTVQQTVVSYSIPATVSDVKLKDGFQIGYLCVWFFAIIFSSIVLIVDWSIVRIFDFQICDIENNNDHANLTSEFGSVDSLVSVIQQSWLTVCCLGGFSLWYLPAVIGIDDEKRIRHSRIALFSILILLQFVVNMLLVPLFYNFRSLFNVLAMVVFFLWGYWYRQRDGVRRLYPLFVTIMLTVVLYYYVSAFILNRLWSVIYAFVYPLYLSAAQIVLLRVLETVDVCKCCKNETTSISQSASDIDTTTTTIDEEQVGSSNSSTTTSYSCLRRYQKTAPILDWPSYYVYFVCAMIVVMAESFRLGSYTVMAKESTSEFILSLVVSVIIECVTRNQLHNILWHKCVKKNSSSASITEVRALFLGCKYHTDYVPILILIWHNILKFGHTNDCYFEKVPFNMDVGNGYEYLIGVFFAYEMVTDLLTFLMYKCLKKYHLLLYNDDHQPIRMSFVILTRTQIILMMISLSYWSLVAFIYDFEARL